jgi:hypothetical protein
VRPLNTAAAALLARIQAGEQVPMVQLVEMVFSPTTERYTTAGHALTWGGHTWDALGVQIEPVDDNTGDMPGLAFVLPGVSGPSIALALVEDVEGVVVRVYDALVDPDTGVVADAVLAWSGTLTMPQLQDGRVAAVVLNAEHRGTTALRPKPSRYTDDEQRRLHPGDTSLDFDPATDAGPLVWPAASFFRQ